MDDVQNILNVMCPVKVNVFKQKYVNKVWITDDIRECMEIRDNLYVRAVNEGNDGVWREYKQMRNYVVAQIKLEKEQYYKQVIDNNKNNPREMWKKLKLLLPGKQTSAPETINFEGQIISDHLSIAQSFNNYFLESIDVIISNIPDSALMGELPVAAPCVAEKFDRFKSLSMTDLKRILNDLKDVGGGTSGISDKWCFSR